MRYNPVTGEILQEITRIVGEKNLLTGKEELGSYAHDETEGERYGNRPEVVVFPGSTEEVARLVKLANHRLIPVTPRGAGSGLSGGAIPLEGGMVISLARMNSILELDEENLMLVTEPGVITSDINRLAAEKGLFFAGYPMSRETCFIGGNIAENAGGGKAVKYGVTGRYVLGLELVTPTGEVLQLGGKRVKDVTGYDLKQLIIGSEGTLGIITRATLRLLPLPRSQVALLVPFSHPDTALALVPKIMTGCGLIPTGIEFMDWLSFSTACDYLQENLSCPQQGAMLLIEVDGHRPEEVEADAEAIGELCLEGGAEEVYVADNRTTRERVWRVRASIPEAFKVISPQQSIEDVVVPTASIAQLLPKIEAISARHGLRIPCYGHAGDGNLHATVIRSPELVPDKYYRQEEKALKDLYRAVLELGGTISGEHGIGSKRRDIFSSLEDPEKINLLRRIKQAFDPRLIMNPGKIFEMDENSVYRDDDRCQSLRDR